MRAWPQLFVLFCLLASCSSSPETARGVETFAAAELPGDAGEDENQAAAGLDIRSIPDEAAVYLNNRYMGVTPLLLTDLQQGRYLLRLTREGYRPDEAWIRYDAAYLRYEFKLEEITGFLQVRSLPVHAEIRVGDRHITASEPVTLPAGRHVVLLRAFGYEDTTAEVTISDGQTTALQVSLAEAPQRLSPLYPSRMTFNPAAPGRLGRITVDFRITAPGGGSVAIFDSSLRRVDSLDLEDFTTREQAFGWAGKDASGAPLSDGSYVIRVRVWGARGESETREVTVIIDSSRVVSHRSLWSGVSGLLFAPTPEILPPQTVQVSTLALGRIGADGRRAPWNAGLRLGLAPALELDTQGGFILGREPAGEEEDPVRPFLVGTALKARLFAYGAAPRLEGALLFNLSYQHARTDTLSNFTGFSAGFPCSLRLGDFLLAASSQLILSPWTVAYDSPLDFNDPDWSLWLYGRAGLLWEAGGWQLGLSTALRSTPLSSGLALDRPFVCGLELHRLIPMTQLYLTLALAAELGSGEDLYAGIGLGLID